MGKAYIDKKLVPPEVNNFFNKLMEEDKQILMEIAHRHEEFENEDQMLEALKAKSEKLHDKALKLLNFVHSKIDALNPEAREFAEVVIDDIKTKTSTYERTLEGLHQMVDEIIEKYNGLSEESKQSLKDNYVKIIKFINDL